MGDDRLESKASTSDHQDSTRSALLAAVRRLISERGDVDFSLTDIANASGKNSALVSYHFGGKEQLLLAALQESTDSLLLPLTDLRNRDLPADEKLRLHLTGLIKVFEKHAYLNILSRVLLRRSSEAAAKNIAEQFIEPIIDFQKSVLDQGKEEGIFRDVDPFAFYITSFGAIDMLFAAKATVRFGFGRETLKKRDLDAFGEELCQTLIAGISA